jgi:BirA family biotin operon repressor/biotin-[acetyl-CoA-carboxylase] ligase
MNAKKQVRRIVLKEVDSTNEYAKSLRADGCQEDVIITAKRQTAGRGTKGRSFSSRKGGVYLTYLRFLEDFETKRAFEIMASAAVAVCKTLETFGLSPVIKWANDVHVNGKKICGILTENTFGGGKVQSSIVGIGLNVNNLLETELQTIATTMRQEKGKRVCLRRVLRCLMGNLQAPFCMDEYLTRLGYMGRRVELLLGNERVPATLLSVDSEGILTVETGGEERRFSSAEISVVL